MKTNNDYKKNEKYSVQLILAILYFERIFKQRKKYIKGELNGRNTNKNHKVLDIVVPSCIEIVEHFEFQK